MSELRRSRGHSHIVNFSDVWDSIHLSMVDGGKGKSRARSGGGVDKAHSFTDESMCVYAFFIKWLSESIKTSQFPSLV